MLAVDLRFPNPKFFRRELIELIRKRQQEEEEEKRKRKEELGVGGEAE